MPDRAQATDGERVEVRMRSKPMGRDTMGWSLPDLLGQRHPGKPQSTRVEVADDRRSQGWNRARRVAGKRQGVGTERMKGQVKMTEISDRRRGHSRRKT